jgi:hypothetical protein
MQINCRVTTEPTYSTETPPPDSLIFALCPGNGHEYAMLTKCVWLGSEMRTIGIGARNDGSGPRFLHLDASRLGDWKWRPARKGESLQVVA